MIETDYSWKWAANATDEEFLKTYKEKPVDLFNTLTSECIDDRNCSLKTLVDPILRKIANLPLLKNIESLMLRFFKKIIKWEGNPHEHIRPLLGLYLKAIYQDKRDLARTTCLLMHSDLAKKAQANLAKKPPLQSLKEKQFLMLSEQGEMVEIQKMIEGGIDVNSSEYLGLTSLHIACIRGNVDLVKLLLSSEKLKIDKTNLQGDTALLIATSRKEAEIVFLLIEKGASFNQANSYGNTPLICLAFKNEVESCRLLLEKGASINRANCDGNTPLMMAAMAGNTELCALLIDNGASLENTSSIGTTAFIASCTQENFSTIELFIEKGALIDVKDKDGQNGADYAAGHNRLSVVDFLAKKNVFPSVGRALAIACNNNDSKKIDFLLKNEDLKKIASYQIHEVLNYAFQRKDFDLFKAVFNKETLKVPAREWLLKAFIENLVEFKEFLQDQGANIDEKINGKTLLHEYSMQNNIQQVKKLLEFGANINALDHTGKTSLMMALLDNHLNIAEYLIDEGADLYIKSKSKSTAFTIANEAHLENLFDKMCQNIIKNYSSK